MNKLTATLVFISVLLTIGVVSAQRPTMLLLFDDSGMNYAQVDDNTDMDEHRLSLAYEAGKLTVAIHSDAREGELSTLRISDLPHYVSFSTDPDARNRSNVRDSTAFNKKVADINDIAQIRFTPYGTSYRTIEIVQERTGLNTAIEAFQSKLESFGFSSAQTGNHTNVRSYVFERGDARLGVSFIRAGQTVTVRLTTL